MPSLTIQGENQDEAGNYELTAFKFVTAFQGISNALQLMAQHGVAGRPFNSAAIEELRAKAVLEMKDSSIEDADLELGREAKVITDAIAMVGFEFDLIIDGFRVREGLPRRLKD